MRRIRIIPTLLIHNGGLVKSVQFKNHKYVGDPINAVKIFNEKEVDEIIILDIDASKNKAQPNFERIAEICGEAFMPLAYGGGINSLQQIEQILYNGAEKVILNTSCFDHPNLLAEGAKRFGAQSIVASMDIKKSRLGKKKVVRNNGSKKTKWSPVDYAKHIEDLGAGELYLNSVDRDGTYSGYDVELLHSISNAISIPVIASGGASSLEDFKEAVNNGASAVSAGSMFVFQRPHQAVLITYPTQKELKKIYG